MQEIIAKSKMYKDLKKRQREADEDRRDEIDELFR